jgi:hypothetical protein
VPARDDGAAAGRPMRAYKRPARRTRGDPRPKNAPRTFALRDVLEWQDDTAP